MSSDTLRFEADGAVLDLDAGRLGSLGAGESPWALAEEPDWSRLDAVRLLAASFGDGLVTALVALRPAGAEGHDADQVTAVIVDRGRARQAHEALVSTELDPDRMVRRVGVELWTSEEPPPHRFAADRTAHSASAADGVRRESTLMDAHLDGERGRAIFEILRPER
jgi:hypothetical protein